MKGKFIICEKHKIALLLVQITQNTGVIGGYNQLLLNAIICAFFTIFVDCEASIKDFDIGYDGWIPGSPYEDFGNSEILHSYMKNNPEVWFCKIIKEQL